MTRRRHPLLDLLTYYTLLVVTGSLFFFSMLSPVAAEESGHLRTGSGLKEESNPDSLHVFHADAEYEMWPSTADEPVTLSFDFNNGRANGWIYESPGRWSIVGGALRMTGLRRSDRRYAYYRDSWTDLVFEASMRKLQGDSDQYALAYGMIVRSDTSVANSYEFAITVDGYYRIGKKTDDEWTSIVNWRRSSLLTPGYGEWSTLMVVCSGSTLEFYINGTRVEAIMDQSFDSGKAGLFAWDDSTSVAADMVEFDDVTLIGTYGDARYQYYLPYFRDDQTHGTGVALDNMDESHTADAQIVVYDTGGNVRFTRNVSLARYGQTSFMIGNGLNTEGWIRVTSDRELAGLCFISTANDAVNGLPAHMMDIMLISRASDTLFAPHVAQNHTWDTTLYVCNPNNKTVRVTFSYRNQGGNEQRHLEKTLPGNGSISVELSEILAGAGVSSGSVIITATDEVAAFSLYTDIKTGNVNYAGIAAMAP